MNDNVDVSGCEFYDNGECSAQQQFAEGELLWIEKCNDTPDCYYKQLQRTKQELQKFQDMAKKGLEEFKDVGGCWGCGLQLQLNQDIEDIKQLKVENAELKAYMDVNEDFKTAWEELKAENERLKEIKDDFFNQAEISHQAVQDKNKIIEKLETVIQEIKEIAEEINNDIGILYNRKLHNRLHKILNIITKAEEE